MKTVAIIQARLGSTRLPGKVMRPLAGRPMIDWVVNRTQVSTQVNQVVVATTTESSDDPLVEYCEQRDWAVVRGSEQDVLSRYVLAAEKFGADNVVRITSDCPLIDPQIVDDVVSKLLEHPANEYACNFFPDRRFPRGLDAEAFTMETLERADQLAIDPAHREHVTLMIYRHPERFRIASVTHEIDLSNYRWTVDTAEDFALVEKVMTSIQAMGLAEDAGLEQFLQLFKQNPDWHLINQSIVQKVA